MRRISPKTTLLLGLFLILLSLLLCPSAEARGGRGGGGRGGGRSRGRSGGRSGGRGRSSGGGRSSGSARPGYGSSRGRGGSSWYSTRASPRGIRPSSAFTGFMAGAVVGRVVGHGAYPYYGQRYGHSYRRGQDDNVCEWQIPVGKLKITNDSLSHKDLVVDVNNMTTVYYLCDASCCDGGCCSLNTWTVVFTVLFIVIATIGIAYAVYKHVLREPLHNWQRKRRQKRADKENEENNMEEPL